MYETLPPGWGATKDKLQSTYASIYSDPYCQAHTIYEGVSGISYYSFDSESEFCAGGITAYALDGTGMCASDGGGPLVCINE